MIGIYLLVTIFSQFAPVSQLINNWAWETTFASTSTEQALNLGVTFDQVNGLKIGSPVLVDGRQVGEVAEIMASDVTGNGEGYSVTLSLNSPPAGKIGTNSIALQASPMSVSRQKAETVIELVSLPGTKGTKLSGGERLAGFSSLEKFWSADSLVREHRS